MADRNQLSPGGAIVIGLLCGAMGTLVMLLALGAGEGRMSDGTPPWVLVCGGLAFVLAGLAIIVGYGIAGGVTPDGDLLPGTPFAVRLVQYLLGLGIVAMLASIASWVAFGGGSRHFTGSGPFISGAVNEALGRTAFGIGAALAWAFMALMIVVSVKRLRRRSLRRVDLLQLTRRPLHGVLRAHALDRLREHVDNDVLAQRFGRLAPRRPRVAHLPRVR